MVFGLIALAGTIPLTATSVLALQSQAENTKNSNSTSSSNPPTYKTEKSHIHCRATARTPSDRKSLFNENTSKIILRAGRLYIQTSDYSADRRGEGRGAQKQYHPFTGYFLPYPDTQFDGLVSTITEDPPQLNWIYMDGESGEMRHGLRVEAEKGVTGPWDARDCDGGEVRFLLEGWEGWVAVETEEVGLWRVCFDRGDDGLRGKVEEGV